MQSIIAQGFPRHVASLVFASVRAVELENQIFGRFFANIPHAVALAGRVVDRTAGTKSFSQRLDGSGELDDRDIVFIGSAP